MGKIVLTNNTEILNVISVEGNVDRDAITIYVKSSEINTYQYLKSQFESKANITNMLYKTDDDNILGKYENFTIGGRYSITDITEEQPAYTIYGIILGKETDPIENRINSMETVVSNTLPLVQKDVSKLSGTVDTIDNRVAEIDAIVNPVVDFSKMTLDEIKDYQRINVVGPACRSEIFKGIDIEMSDGKIHHFSLTLEDQTKINAMGTYISIGMNNIPYHPDAGECIFYSNADATALLIGVSVFVARETTICNKLNMMIREAKSVEEVTNIKWGITLSDEDNAYVDNIVNTFRNELIEKINVYANIVSKLLSCVGEDGSFDISKLTSV